MITVTAITIYLIINLYTGKSPAELYDRNFFRKTAYKKQRTNSLYKKRHSFYQ